MLPVLVLVLWGIIEFGQGFNAKVELSGAVREGARAAALSSATSSAALLAEAEAATRNAAPGLDAGSITVTVPEPCPASGEGTAKVTATDPYAYDIPFFGTGTWTITAKGAMRCGG